MRKKSGEIVFRKNREKKKQKSEDIAEAVAYLHAAGFVTGQHLNIDGGMTAKMIYEH